MTASGNRRLLHYSLIEKIGTGGMGEVWRASDTTLSREVAIKILPELLARDPERLARFDREARVLAALNHPNIAGIYGLHSDGGERFLALELVGGPELAARIAMGAMPPEEVIPIAIQIAQALEYAHERGIVHRDLKPANIKITHDGGVKVLDFGLAKALSGEGDDAVISAAMPTITSAGTRMGTILGTAAYMSPEQARGKSVDRRSDIWAFGCVLYEMLSGRRTFEGETASDTLAAVLRQEVDWSVLPAATPSDLQRLLHRCLQRDPRQRLHDIADARIWLEEIGAGTLPATAPMLAGARRARWPWLAIGLVAGVLAGASSAWLRPTREGVKPVPVPTSFRQLTTTAGGEGEPALAPDGQSFAFVKGDVQDDIFVQRVDGRNAINLTADSPVDDGQPAFAPDGQQIAFRSERAGGGIFIMGATGENVRRLADFGYNPAWSPDGKQIAVVTEGLGLPWGRVSESRLWAIDVESGERRLLSENDAMQPAWSPDGKTIAFWGLDRSNASSQRDLWVIAAGNDAPQPATRLLNDRPLDWNPVWEPDGQGIFFASTRGGTMNLWRLPIDRAGGRASGEPTPVTAPSSWVGWMSISQRGDRIAFVDRNARRLLQRAPFDPVRGVIAGPVQPVPLGTTELYEVFDLSPDGNTVLFVNAGLPQHLFIANCDGTGFRQLTDGPHRDRQARFSPDGQWIAFQTSRFPSGVGVVRADGSGLREVKSKHDSGWYPTWSPDGKRLFLTSENGSFVLDVDAANPSAGTLQVAPPGRVFMPSAWHADGRRVIGGAVSTANNVNEIVSLNLADGAFQTLLSTTGRGTIRCCFLPDRQRFLFSSDDKIMVQDRRGTTREILAAPAGHAYADLSLSSDGRWLAFLEIWDESDIWMAEFQPTPPAAAP